MESFRYTLYLEYTYLQLIVLAKAHVKRCIDCDGAMCCIIACVFLAAHLSPHSAVLSQC